MKTQQPTNRFFPEPGVNPESEVDVFNPDVIDSAPNRIGRDTTDVDFKKAIKNFEDLEKAEFAPGNYSEREVASGSVEKVAKFKQIGKKVLALAGVAVAVYGGAKVMGRAMDQMLEPSPQAQEYAKQMQERNEQDIINPDGVLKVHSSELGKP